MAEPETNGASQSNGADVDMTDADPPTARANRVQIEDGNASGQEGENTGGASRMAASGVKLEDLFDLGSDDDEFSSSHAAAKEQPNSPDLLPSSPMYGTALNCRNGTFTD